MSELEDILRVNPSPEEWAQLKEGVRLHENGEYQRAIEVLNKVVLTLPYCDQEGESLAHQTLAECYEELGQFEKGLQELKLALDCYSEDEIVSDVQKSMRRIYQLLIEHYYDNHPEVRPKSL